MALLRAVRRRFKGMRGEPLATFTLRVVAASPFPDEPEEDKNYQPALLVESLPEPDDPSGAAPGPGQLAIGALLFVEWAQGRLGDSTLPLRLRAVLPRLRLAVEAGTIGPAHYAAHRAGQRERYYHHREAATYAVELHLDDDGLYVAVESRVQRGRWTDEATLLDAATLAPYEALLRLDLPAQAALLAWLHRAVARWLDEEDPDFPVREWDPSRPLAPPEAMSDEQ